MRETKRSLVVRLCSFLFCTFIYFAGLFHNMNKSWNTAEVRPFLPQCYSCHFWEWEEKTKLVFPLSLSLSVIRKIGEKSENNNRGGGEENGNEWEQYKCGMNTMARAKWAGSLIRKRQVKLTHHHHHHHILSRQNEAEQRTKKRATHTLHQQHNNAHIHTNKKILLLFLNSFFLFHGLT